MSLLLTKCNLFCQPSCWTVTLRLRRQQYFRFYPGCPANSNRFLSDQCRALPMSKLNDAPSSSTLPDPIEKDRQKWIRLLTEEQNVKMAHKSQTPTERHFQFLERPMDWPNMPGYAAMLTVYGLVSDTTPNPDPIEKTENVPAIDRFQKAALAAALNPNRPIVAVVGSPGSGKTKLVAEYARLLSIKEEKRVLVVCGSKESMYSTLCVYLKRIRGSKENFVHLQPYDEEMAIRLAPKVTVMSEDRLNTTAREKLSERSLVEMIKRRGLNVSMADVLKNQSTRDENMVVFATPEDIFGLLDKLYTEEQQQPLFDVIVLEDSNLINELDSWRLALPLAPLVRLFGESRQLVPPVHSAIALQEDFHQRAVIHRIENENKHLLFILLQQYRSNQSVQLWTARTLYKITDKEFARPMQIDLANELNICFLLDRLIIDGSLQTDPLVFVDTDKLDGAWTASMFRPMKVTMPDTSSSFVNWGEAILAAAHLNSMLQNGMRPSQMAFFAQISAHCEAVRRILFLLNPDLKFHYERVEIGHAMQYLGRDFESVVKSFITSDILHSYFNQRLLQQYLSFEFTRAKRQILLIASLMGLRQLRTLGSSHLIRAFQQRASFVAPSDIFRLETSQFEHIVREINLGEGTNKFNFSSPMLGTFEELTKKEQKK